MSRTAIVLGCTGQVGSFIVEALLEEGWHVVGALRRTSTPSAGRLGKALENPRMSLAFCDVTDAHSVESLLRRERPRWVVNMAAQSFVRASFEEPLHSTSATYLGAVNLLEAARRLQEDGLEVKLYQASSSEMFGAAWSKLDSGGLRLDISHRPPTPEEMAPGLGQAFQDEATPFFPNSPYAVAKLSAHHMARIYRKSYGVWVACGIMFNTESERRGEEFVTRKVTRYVGRLRVATDNGMSLPLLRLGNLSAHRDWSFAGDTARAVLRVLSREEPDDYVLATGSSYSVEEFVRRAFLAGGFGDWREFVEGNVSCHERPCEVPFLRGRSAKARHVLGWEPRVGLDQLIERMVASDIELAVKELSCGA